MNNSEKIGGDEKDIGECSPEQLKWLLELDLHKIAMGQLREQQYIYRKEKNTVKRS